MESSFNCGIPVDKSLTNSPSLNVSDSSYHSAPANISNSNLTAPANISNSNHSQYSIPTDYSFASPTHLKIPFPTTPEGTRKALVPLTPPNFDSTKNDNNLTSPSNSDLTSKTNSNSPGFSPIARNARYSQQVPYIHELSNKIYNKRATISATSPLSSSANSPSPFQALKLTTSSFSPNLHFIPPSMSREKAPQNPSPIFSKSPNLRLRSSLQSPLSLSGGSSPLTKRLNTSADYDYGTSNRTMPANYNSPNNSMVIEHVEQLNRTWSVGSEANPGTNGTVGPSGSLAGTSGTGGTGKKSDSLLAKHRQSMDVLNQLEEYPARFSFSFFLRQDIKLNYQDMQMKVLKISNYEREPK